MTERVLITGASRGIGASLAHCFAADGCALVLTARSADELEALAIDLRAQHRSDVQVIAADLAAPDGVDTLLHTLRERDLGIDTLVNNAGFGTQGDFSSTPAAHVDGMLAVNVVAPTRLAHALLPAMRARRTGGVLNVASTAAFLPGPYMAEYYATKAYLLNWSEALFHECRDDGVVVTALCPGPTHTGFAERARIGNKLLFRASVVMDADSVARIGHRAYRAGRPRVVAGWPNKVLVASMRLAPRAALRRLTARLNR